MNEHANIGKMPNIGVCWYQNWLFIWLLPWFQGCKPSTNGFLGHPDVDVRSWRGAVRRIPTVHLSRVSYRIPAIPEASSNFPVFWALFLRRWRMWCRMLLGKSWKRKFQRHIQVFKNTSCGCMIHFFAVPNRYIQFFGWLKEIYPRS